MVTLSPEPLPQFLRDLLEDQRLAKNTHRAGVQTFLSLPLLTLLADHEDDHRQIQFSDRFQGRQTAFAAHQDVERQRIGLVFLKEVDGLCPVPGGAYTAWPVFSSMNCRIVLITIESSAITNLAISLPSYIFSIFSGATSMLSFAPNSSMARAIFWPSMVRSS